MELRITIYGEEGRSTNKPLEDYIKIAVKQNEFDLSSANLHIKTLLSLAKENSQRVVDMIENDDPYMILALDGATSSADFYAKMFKDYTTGFNDGSVVLKLVIQDGQIAPTIGVFRSEDSFNRMFEKIEENDTLNTKAIDITLKKIQELIDS